MKKFFLIFSLFLLSAIFIGKCIIYYNNNKNYIEYKTNPKLLLYTAQEAFKVSNLQLVKEKYIELKTYYSNSEEYIKVKHLYEKLDSTIKIQTELYNKYKIREDSLNLIKKDSIKNLKLKTIQKLTKTYDDFKQITWYENSYFTHRLRSNHLSIYMGQKEESIWLILKLSYCGMDWIFFDKAYLYCDGKVMNINFNEYDKNSDNNIFVWEWINIFVDDDLYNFLKNVPISKNVKIRLYGKYTYTKNIDNVEKKAIKEILDAYEILNSNL